MILAGLGNPMAFFVVSGLLLTAVSLLTGDLRLRAGFEVVGVEASEAVTLVPAAVLALVVLVGTEDIECVSFARELVD